MKNSISSRLAGMVLGTFLPVNLLAILVCRLSYGLRRGRREEAEEEMTDDDTQ